MTYQEIADEIGYANRGTAFAIVRNALDSHEAEEIELHRSLEAVRLDRLQVALWGSAMAGEVAAAAQVRRIIEARIRLLGLLLDGVPQDDGRCRTVICSCPPGSGHRRR